MPTESLRLDQALVLLGHYASREQARRALIAGEVEVNGSRLAKPGLKVALRYPEDGESQEPELHAGSKPLSVVIRTRMPYVSRGGFKLVAGLECGGIDPAGLVCLDVGASTGGFSDVLLQRGASHVYAVDCGYGQLHDKIRHDERVTVMEKTNARFLTPDNFPLTPQLAVADVSFISLRLILPVMKACLAPGGAAVVLVKPQFEAGPEQVGKGGVVRDEAVRLGVLAGIRAFMEELGFSILGQCESPIIGPAGNHEFLLAGRLA